MFFYKDMLFLNDYIMPGMTTVKILKYIFALSVISFSTVSLQAKAETFHNIPDDLLAKAVSSEVVYDEEFDYTKLGATSNLMNTNAFTESQAQKKMLVDRVVVNKAAHQMILMKDGQEIRKFWIALSDKPYGKKQFEGDKKTPEGTYTLDYIKQRSNYYKAFHISYPNSKDIEFARSYGRRPGGMIMVHGQPPSRSSYNETVQRTDWTNGCIALLNPDLDVFLSMVDVGTPITINP